MNREIKALIIKPSNLDLGRVLHYAYAEGKKLLGTKRKIKVLDVVHRPYGWICVVGESTLEDREEKNLD